MATLELVEGTPLDRSVVVKQVEQAVRLNASLGNPTALSPRGAAGVASSVHRIDIARHAGPEID
jgi:hypothetical protein